MLHLYSLKLLNFILSIWRANYSKTTFNWFLRSRAPSVALAKLEASTTPQYHKPALLVLFQLPPTKATLENEAKRLVQYKTYQIPYKKPSTVVSTTNRGSIVKSKSKKSSIITIRISTDDK